MDIGRTDDLLDLSAELRDDRLRGLARREQGVPPQNFEAGKSRLRNRGNIRYQLAARETGDGEGAQLARLHLRQHGRNGKEYEIDVAGEHAGHRFGTTLVRYMAHVDPRHALEQLGREVSGRSFAGRRIGQLTGFSRASAIRSASDFTGSDAFATSRFGATATIATGGTSRMGS